MGAHPKLMAWALAGRAVRTASSASWALLASRRGVTAKSSSKITCLGSPWEKPWDGSGWLGRSHSVKCAGGGDLQHDNSPVLWWLLHYAAQQLVLRFDLLVDNLESTN